MQLRTAILLFILLSIESQKSNSKNLVCSNWEEGVYVLIYFKVNFASFWRIVAEERPTCSGCLEISVTFAVTKHSVTASLNFFSHFELLPSKINDSLYDSHIRYTSSFFSGPKFLIPKSSGCLNTLTFNYPAKTSTRKILSKIQHHELPLPCSIDFQGALR